MSVGPKQSHLRGHLGATRAFGNRPLCIDGCVLRTRYAAPVGFVDTPRGLAGLVLPLTNVLCIWIPVMLWVFSELRFFTKESEEIASFVIEVFCAACGNL